MQTTIGYGETKATPENRLDDCVNLIGVIRTCTFKKTTHIRKKAKGVGRLTTDSLITPVGASHCSREAGAMTEAVAEAMAEALRDGRLQALRGAGCC